MGNAEDKPSILIVDDDENTCKSLALIFRKKGYTVATASTGKEALEQTQSTSFNLALLDIKLPDMVGIDLISQLKANQSDIEICMATAYASKENAIEALNRGAAAYILKPFDMSEVLATLDRLLEKQRLVIENRKLLEEVQTELAERKKAEEALRKSTRAYKILSECNQTLVRASDETDLLNDVCREIVKTGGYRMVWVGFAEHDRKKTVRPAAHQGYEEGYLDTLNITWADNQRGQGPTGAAIRTGQPVIVRDIQSDPAFKPWRKEAAKRSYASFVALPLKTDDQIIGALNIYAPEPNAFAEEELKLLIELADDLAYGIAALRTQAEHKRAEAALRETTEKLKTSIDNMPNAYILCDIETQVLKWNRAAEKIFGYSEEEMLGKNLIDFVVPEKVRDLVGEAINKLKVGEVADYSEKDNNIRKDGKLISCQWFNTPLADKNGKVFGILFMAQDVTERKQAEEALRESEERYRAVTQNAPDAIIVADHNGSIISWNQGAGNIFGYNDEEILGQPLTKLIPKRYQDRHKKGFERVSAGGQQNVIGRTMELCGLRKDGKEFPLEISLSTWETEQGIFCTGIIRDITDRRAALVALKESEERLKILFENAPDGIFLYDLKGIFVDGNKAVEEMIGYQHEELIGKKFLKEQLLSTPQMAKAAKLLAQTALGQPTGPDEYSLKRKDGTQVPVEIRTHPVQIKGETLVLGIARDITAWKAAQMEREQLFDEISESQTRLRALSTELVKVQEKERRQLARELHDEIGQSLTAVRLNLQKIKRDNVDRAIGGQLIESMEIVNDALEKVRNLSLDLRPAMLDDLGLAPTLRWYLDRQSKLAGYTTKLDDTQLSGRPPAEIETVCFRIVQEALTNIAKHSAATKVDVILDDSAQELHITVRDNGRGFDVVRAIQEAKAGKSLGILSMQERASLVGGSLDITSKRAKGTTIQGSFPLGKS